SVRPAPGRVAEMTGQRTAATFETWGSSYGRESVARLESTPRRFPLSPFELAEPRTLAEAFAALKSADGNVRPMSGGTALMLMMKTGVLRPTRLVSLRRLGLDKIEVGSKGELRIGAMVTLRALERSPHTK